MDTLENYDTLKDQSRWSGKRVVLLYWMALLFLGTGVAIGIGTQVINPRYEMRSPNFDHSGITGEWGAADCSGCHSAEHTAWDAAGHSSITFNGSHYFPTPYYALSGSRFNATGGCYECFTTNPTNESGVLDWWDLGITCAACHEPGVVDHDASNCGECHTGGSHAIYEDHMISPHNDSLADCLASGHPGDHCMVCVSGQGTYWPGAYTAVEYNLWVNNTDLTGITCATCHDPHGNDNEAMLREDNTLDLCGTCHGTSERHSDYEQLTDTTYKATHFEFNCTSCHGYDAEWQDTDHNETNGLEPFEFNHTWYMDIPEGCNQEGCHTDKTVADVEARQDEVTPKYTAYETLLATVQDKVDEANETDGVDQDKVDEAYALVDEAEDLALYFESDGSAGYHNPAYMKAKLDAAMVKLNEANDVAEEAIEGAGDDDGIIPGFEFTILISAISLLGVAALYLRKRRN